MSNKISIPSDISNLTSIYSFLDAIFLEHSISEDLYDKVLISLIEAVTNSIVHGNDNDISKFVDISYSLDSQCITFSVKDQGNGFDFESIPNPILPENVNKPTGRGIFLLSQLCSSYTYLEKGSKILIIFNLA